MDLVVSAYRLTKELPDTERFGLASQMQRSAVSVPADIAEGYARARHGEYLRHLSVAQGSLAELETHLTIAVRLEYLDRRKAMDVWNLAQRVGKMLGKLVRSPEKAPDRSVRGNGGRARALSPEFPVPRLHSRGQSWSICCKSVTLR